MNIKSSAWMTGAVIASALTVSGCATTGYVNDHFAVEDQKVTAQQTQLDQHDARLSAVDASAHAALDRANAAGQLAAGKFVYSSVLSDDSIKFTPRSAQLTSEAQTRLMDMVQKLKADNKNVYLEIQGHVDPGESRAGAMRLGTERAEAVRRFLYQQGVPLNRMSTISYGATTPATPDKTREGRAQNRRVVVVVMA
jgi:outer membrane protein OmpA-like peptidoglycan-associated protein